MDNNSNREHIVDFEKWCPTCKYKDYPQEAIPCCYCLDEATNTDSRKPVKWKKQEEPEKKKKVNKIKKG